MALIFKFIKGKITEQDIQVADRVPNFQTGAKAIFKGCVRNDLINGNEVSAIEFTAHERIAEIRCLELMQTLSTKFVLQKILICHSLGTIKAGDTCFYVEIHSAHRKEAFMALPELVDLFKLQIPIFGKEIMYNGKTHWKENKY